MTPRRSLLTLGAFAATFVPMYVLERVTDSFYFASDPLFFTFSGIRMELFITIVLLGSIIAGIVIDDVWEAAASQGAAIGTMFALTFYLCDPRVCYSSGLDGLEPLRLGLFLFAVSVVGVSEGKALHGPATSGRSWTRSLAFFSCFALSYYPVIFTFAGTKLLSPTHPWSVALLLGIACCATSIGVSKRFGLVQGFLLPLGSVGLAFAISWGLAAAYSGLILVDLSILVLGAISGSLLGVVALRRSPSFFGNQSAVTRSLLVGGLVLVLLMTLVIIPDAVSGLVPNGQASGADSFLMGMPFYAGGYMDSVLGRTTGVEVNVSFAGNASLAVQQDNYLSAGIGAHSPGCCVDGIDYAYRFDLYMYSGGRGTLLASAWEVCDDNAACGGHSWKVLMYVKANAVVLENGAWTLLRMTWEGHGVQWTYSTGAGAMTEFASFTAPAAENADFNTGIVGGGSPFGNQQVASYFLQFGIMSRYPVARGGWSVSFSCPATLSGGSWSCAGHLRTLQGGESYWKVLWRWGEDYPDVTASSQEVGTFTIRYTPGSTMPSFSVLW